MFATPQPPSVVPNSVDIVPVSDPPRALGFVLRFIYPSPIPPAVDDFTLLSETLVIADKYDIEVARARLQPSFVDFAKTEPLKAYAVACRFGLTDEMKIASSHTTSLYLPDLAKLPDEFELVPATEYHRLILLHSKYRKEVKAIASRTLFPRPVIAGLSDIFAALATEGDSERTVRERHQVRHTAEPGISCSCVESGRLRF